MKLKADSTEKKLRGGYYTPDSISDFIIRWALTDRTNQDLSVLEPSCGDGAFLESLIRNTPIDNINCLAVELIESEAISSRDKVRGFSGFEVIQDDFYSVFMKKLKKRKFNLIVGNPPYIRYQYLTPEQRETQSSILVANNMKSNKLINSWVSFMVACVQMLAQDGKIGMVIPAELMQVAYAEDLRMFLVNNLSQITVITFEELVFPNVQQEVVLFLGEKYGSCNHVENQIRVIQLKNLSSLENNNLHNIPIRYIPVDHSKDKWTKYFLTSDEIELINEVKKNKKFVTFGDIASVDIGITTGDNKYFSVSKDTVEEYGLHDTVLPLIGRSAHAKGLYFNYEDWLDNVNKGLNAQLIHFPDIPYEDYPVGYKNYIELGEKKGVNKGYKCSIRDKWYRIPSVYIPDAFFLRRNNYFPKFVLNNLNAVSTDTMHRIRFKENINHKNALLSYYNSITFAFTEIEGRSYGGGVLEVLPGEVEKIILPNLQDLSSTTVTDLIERIDKAIRENQDIEPILDDIDNIVLVDHIGMDINKVKMFRNIWKRLIRRRHARNK